MHGEYNQKNGDKVMYHLPRLIKLKDTLSLYPKLASFFAS